MARDFGLEELIREQLGERPRLRERPMFGGLAWLLDGRLLCGASHRGMMLRLGKGRDGWALAMAGIAPMTMRGRPMSGWIRVEAEVVADDALAPRLFAAALQALTEGPGDAD